MNPPEAIAVRGRPRTITRERIADAGIALGLNRITFVGVAAALGVSHMALYKHVPSLDELKHLVVEEIFKRWQIPQAAAERRDNLQSYLFVFVESVRALVKAHPGLTPYVIRRMAATPSMIKKIADHQNHIAQAFALPKDRARWLLATVAFNCLAAADTVYSVAGREPVVPASRSSEEAEMEVELIDGMKALVIGTLSMLDGSMAKPPSTVTSSSAPSRKGIGSKRKC